MCSQSFFDTHQNNGLKTELQFFKSSILQFSLYLCTCNREITPLFIRLVVLGRAKWRSQAIRFFKVKFMLLDFQTTVMLVAVAVATVLSIVTLVHTDFR